MNETTSATKPAPVKPPQPAKPSPPRALDETDAVPVRRLMFRESVDVPGEQRVNALSPVARSGRPRYQILWLPRVHVYLVRASEMQRPDVWTPTHTFTVHDSWAIAEIEAA